MLSLSHFLRARECVRLVNMRTMWRDDINQNTNPLRFILFVSRPYRVSMWIAVICVVLASILNIVSTYSFKLIVDASQSIANGGTLMSLWYAAAFYITLSLGGVLFWRTSGFAGMLWATGVRATARYALTSYATLHSQEYFGDRFSGSISSKVTHAANSTKDIAEQFLWQMLGFVVTTLAAFVAAFLTSPLVSFIFLGWVCIITPLNVYFARHRIPLSSVAQRKESILGGATVDLFSNMSAVHEYARRPFELSRLKKLIIERRVAGLQNWRYGEIRLLINGILQTVFVGAMIIISVYLVSRGALTAGDLIFILTLILVVEDRLTFIGNQLNQFGDNWGQVVESLSDILVPHDVADGVGSKDLAVRTGDVALDRISFGYGGVNIFRDLSLSIPHGQKVGIVGRSGAGKSTLVKLLLRHYDLNDGRIMIDGIDIADTTKESLRRAIAIVPQESLLFHRSIYENIAYGKPQATRADVEAAARLAEAHDFIMKLPHGYNALVGERGVKLSGGQRQRIAIARALIKDAPILLLDEATASLDSESEVAVQRALLALVKKRTVIAIAHRLSTLRAMDRIIVMDDGRIVEDGTHEELLARGGLYADLWNHQAGGFIEA